MVEPVPETISFPSEEEKILQLWNEKDCFLECLKQSKNRPKYIQPFYSYKYKWRKESLHLPIAQDESDDVEFGFDSSTDPN